MNQLTLSYDAVTTQNGQPITTSLEVAKYFGKNHQHILRDISQFYEPDSGLSKVFSASNFGRAEYFDAQKKPRPMYYITKDGFALLAMGFTGKDAMRFKESCIMAFNQMAATLRSAETHFAALAKIELQKRYPQMETVRVLFSRSALSVERIARDYQMSPSTVRRNLKRNLQWGTMTEAQLAAAQQAHREFKTAMKQVMAEKVGAA
jgi:Rha family phage regulatory protein